MVVYNPGTFMLAKSRGQGEARVKRRGVVVDWIKQTQVSEGSGTVISISNMRILSNVR